MYLTKQNAHLYEGKTLDAHKHILGAYPYTVQRTTQGELLYFNRAGVGIVIPDEKDKFNAVYFDIVIDRDDGGGGND